ncbi:hypothetical protein [Spiroplasma alleghenense]|uniref:Transmembrane protein n=1 Tax=Spiroplasma alleghenense TaxID=216931 RepID=A0A345Z2I1_9MOLU|nr:hypothetical protein [Spiroplasma alleghenense]AXK50810.1 hypothetical protein SALLE_v1c01340 [Spiroplasma alleghenense]
MSRWYLGLTIAIMALAGFSFYWVWDLNAWFTDPNNFITYIQDNFILNLEDTSVLPVFSGKGMFSFYILFAFDAVILALSVYLIGYAIYLGLDGFGRVSSFIWALIPGIIALALASTQIALLAKLYHEFSTAPLEFGTFLDFKKEQWYMVGKFENLFIFNGVTETYVPNPQNEIVKLITNTSYVGYVTAGIGVLSPLLYLGIRR